MYTSGISDYRALMTATAQVGTVRAVTYRRISDDREGDELGVERQAEDLAKHAAERGYLVVDDYEDNDVSASTRSKKPRPDYERLLEDAKAGRFDVVLAYTSSRLTRRPRELEDLIDLAQEHGIRFDYIRSPSFDLNTADGRQIARMLASADAGEAERTAERVQRAALQRAKKGEWHGGAVPPFGYELVRDDKGKVTTLRIHAERAELLREAARRLLGGESLYAVVSDWNGRGITTQTGTWWRPSTLRRALLAPSAIGHRTRRVRDTLTADTVSDDDLYPAWDAILDRATWDRLRDLFRTPARRTFNPLDGSYAGKRALNRLVFCELCRKRLMSQTHRGKKRFVCDRLQTGGCGKVTINYAQLEGFIGAAIFEKLDGDDFRSALTDQQPEDTKEATLRRELRELETERQNVLRAFDRGWRTEAETDDRVAEIKEQREAIERRLTGIRKAHALDWLAGADPAEIWYGANLGKKRALVASLIRRIEIRPFPPGVATTLTQRVKQGESDADFTLRKAIHVEGVLRERVVIDWR